MGVLRFLLRFFVLLFDLCHLGFLEGGLRSEGAAQTIGADVSPVNLRFSGRHLGGVVEVFTVVHFNLIVNAKLLGVRFDIFAGVSFH